MPVLASLLVAITFAGCTDDDTVGARVRTSYYTVHNDEWTPVKDSDGNLLYYYVKCSNTNVDFDNGAVTAYYCTEEGDKALPYTIYNAADVNNVGTIDAYYEDHLSYDIQKDGVTFILESSDFNVAETMARVGEMQFRISVIRNEYLNR